MKDMYKHVIVGIDGSDQADKAFHKAVRIARESDATLYIVSALQFVSDSDFMYTTMDVGITPLVTDSSDASYQALDARKELANDLADQASRAGVAKAVVIVDFDDPKQLLIDTVDKREDAVIVLGATTKKTFERFMVGSVAQHVVNNAPCDVLIVK